MGFQMKNVEVKGAPVETGSKLTTRSSLERQANGLGQPYKGSLKNAKIRDLVDLDMHLETKDALRSSNEVPVAKLYGNRSRLISVQEHPIRYSPNRKDRHGSSVKRRDSSTGSGS